MSNLNVSTIQNTSSVNSITIDTSGRVLYPQNPAFCARNSSNPNGDGTIRIIVFPTIDFNIGSGYNSTTGRFTAPITGIYMINFTAFFAGNTGRDLTIIQVNGSNIQEYTQEQPTPSAGQGYATCRGSMIYRLSTNDYVTIFGEGTLIGSASAYSTFSCCLVC